MKTLLLPALLLLGCSAPPRGFEERLVATLPIGAAARQFKFSRDGAVEAYILDEAGKDHLILHGRRGSPLDKI